MNKKCVVNGCTNRGNEGFGYLISFASLQLDPSDNPSRFICSPCLNMLQNGKCSQSEAWFVKDIERLNKENLILRQKVKDCEETYDEGYGWLYR